MPRHTTFRVSPELPKSPYFPDPLTLLARKHDQTEAVGALGQVFEDQPQSELPVIISTTRGRLRLRDRANLFQFDVREMELGRTPEGYRTYAYLFHDRSVLVAQALTDAHITDTPIRVLPLILRLRQKNRYLSCGKTEHIRIDTHRAHFTPYRENLPATFLSHLKAELHAWAMLFDLLPHAIPTQVGQPISGQLGVDIAAPRPELAGQPYDWPAALPICRSSRARIVEYHHFIHQAWLAASALVPGIRGNPEIDLTVSTLLPSQMQHRSGPDISLHWGKAGRLNLDPEGRVMNSFKRYLAHPSAPAGLDEMISNIWRQAPQKKYFHLASEQFYRSTRHAPASAHEVMSACERFADLPAPVG